VGGFGLGFQGSLLGRAFQNGFFSNLQDQNFGFANPQFGSFVGGFPAGSGSFSFEAAPGFPVINSGAAIGVALPQVINSGVATGVAPVPGPPVINGGVVTAVDPFPISAASFTGTIPNGFVVPCPRNFMLDLVTKGTCRRCPPPMIRPTREIFCRLRNP
jgi:hypothetical protein